MWLGLHLTDIVPDVGDSCASDLGHSHIFFYTMRHIGRKRIAVEWVRSLTVIGVSQVLDTDHVCVQQ